MSHLPGVNVLAIIFPPVWGMLSDGLDELILFFKKKENNRKNILHGSSHIAEHGSTR